MLNVKKSTQQAGLPAAHTHTGDQLGTSVHQPPNGVFNGRSSSPAHLSRINFILRAMVSGFATYVRLLRSRDPNLLRGSWRFLHPHSTGPSPAAHSRQVFLRCYRAWSPAKSARPLALEVGAASNGLLNCALVSGFDLPMTLHVVARVSFPV